MAKVIQLRAAVEPTGKVLMDPASASRIALGNRECQEAAEPARTQAARNRPKLDGLNRRIGKSYGRVTAIEGEFKEKAAGKTHVPPMRTWVTVVVFAVLFIAEFAIADGLLDYAYLQGRAYNAATFLEHFKERGFFEGLVYAVTDYSTPKEWAAAGISTITFFAAKGTGTWIRQRAAGRSAVPAWLVIAFNSVFLASCAGFVLLRYAALASNADSADFAYLAPVFLFLQLLFYAGATLLSAWNADPDPEATRLATLLRRERRTLEKLVRERAAVSAEVTSALVAAQAKCDQIRSQALWDVMAYRTANLKYRDPSEPAPDFLTAAVSPGVFEPIEFDPPTDGPADTLEEILKRTGSR